MGHMYHMCSSVLPLLGKQSVSKWIVNSRSPVCLRHRARSLPWRTRLHLQGGILFMLPVLLTQASQTRAFSDVDDVLLFKK